MTIRSRLLTVLLAFQMLVDRSSAATTRFGASTQQFVTPSLQPASTTTWPLTFSAAQTGTTRPSTQSGSNSNPGNNINNPTICQFFSHLNRNSAGGTSVGIKELSDCQAMCVQHANKCQFGFDYSSATKECWLSINFNTGPSSGVDHYDCFKVTTGPTLLPPTSTSTIPPFNTATTTLPTTRAICTWKEMKDTNTRNGVVRPATTLDECKTICIATDRCAYGFDWVESSTATQRCYISTTNQQGVLPGVTHHSCIPPAVNHQSSANRDQPFVTGFLAGLILLKLLI